MGGFSLLKFMFPTMYALWRIAALNKEKQYNRYSKFSKKLSLFWNYPSSFYNKTVHKTKIMVGVNNRALNKVFLWRTKIYFPEETQRKWKNFFCVFHFLGGTVKHTTGIFIIFTLFQTKLGNSLHLWIISRLWKNTLNITFLFWETNKERNICKY